jgi:hypothetical protein
MMSGQFWAVVAGGNPGPFRKEFLSTMKQKDMKRNPDPLLAACLYRRITYLELLYPLPLWDHEGKDDQDHNIGRKKACFYVLGPRGSPKFHMLKSWSPACGATGRWWNLEEVGPMEGR